MSHKIAYSDATKIQLAELLDYTRVRTIPVDCRRIPCGVGECPIILELERESPLREKLPPMLKNAMFVYAYVRAEQAIWKLFGGYGRHRRHEKLRLNEYRDGFLLFVCRADGREEPIYLVEKDDVAEMLSKARHPAEK